MSVYRKCSRCGKKIEQYSQCECYVQAKKDSYKRYKDRRRLDKEDKARQDFYSSQEWIRIRDVIRIVCYGLDIVKLYKDNLIEQGYTVHHIIPLEDCWNSRLDICNLIYVSQSTHMYIHSEYDKGPKQKKAMQKILFELLDKFNREYK